MPVALSRYGESAKTLSPKFNFVPRASNYKLPNDARILHFPGPKETDWYLMRKKYEKVEEVLNKVGYEDDFSFLKDFSINKFGHLKAFPVVLLTLLKEKGIDLESHLRKLRFYL